MYTFTGPLSFALAPGLKDPPTMNHCFSSNAESDTRWTTATLGKGESLTSKPFPSLRINGLVRRC
jgi:hypothetical protein